MSTTSTHKSYSIQIFIKKIFCRFIKFKILYVHCPPSLFSIQCYSLVQAVNVRDNLDCSYRNRHNLAAHSLHGNGKVYEDDSDNDC